MSEQPDTWKTPIDYCLNYIDNDLYQQQVKIPAYGLPIKHELRLLHQDLLRLYGRDIKSWSLPPPNSLTQVQLAVYLATMSHFLQEDRLGVPYIYHCLRVASAQTTEEAMIVALLHDIWNFEFQDGRVNFKYIDEYLVSLFGEDILNNLTFLNSDYSTRTVEILDARADTNSGKLLRDVVLADIKDNLRPGISEQTRTNYLQLLRSIETIG